MGYNGLAKDFINRWGKGNTPDANEEAPEAQSERASMDGGVPQDWNDDAQDQISALLDEVTDDAEDDAIDLAAIRRALVRQDADPVASDASDADVPAVIDCVADLNDDGAVDALDLRALLSDMGPCP